MTSSEPFLAFKGPPKSGERTRRHARGDYRSPAPGRSATGPGLRPEPQDYEYIRHGMCSVFMPYSPLESWREVRVTGQRTAGDYAHTIRWLCDEVYAQADKIALVQDNLLQVT